jgi:hypothetical protein
MWLELSSALLSAPVKKHVMAQQFVDRVVVSVCRLKLPPPRCAPGGVVFGDAPLEDNLNLFPLRNLRMRSQAERRSDRSV